MDVLVVDVMLLGAYGLALCSYVRNNGDLANSPFLSSRRIVKGQSLVEYALLLVLVSIVVVIVLALLGGSVGNVYQNILDTLQPISATPTPPSCCD